MSSFAMTIAVLVHSNELAIIQNTSSRSFFQAGDVVRDQRFSEYNLGARVNVNCNLSPKGELIVRSLYTPGPNGNSYPPVREVRTNALLFTHGEKPKPFDADALVGSPSLDPVEIPEEEAPPLLDYFISDEARVIFTAMHKMSLARPERASKLMITGPSGYGKTTLVYEYAKKVGKEYMRMNCASIRDPEEWFGYREAREGSTVFITSPFMDMLCKGNCVVVLDEFNRLEPWLHNTLFPLLDDDGKTTIHGQEFAIGEGVVIVATINYGHKYTGVFELDEALYNRFRLVLEVAAMPPHREIEVLMSRTGVRQETAEKVVQVANILRESNINCSTRSTLDICEQYMYGMELRTAFECTVVRRIPADSIGSSLRKKAIDLINVNISHLKIEVPSDDVFAVAQPSAKALAPRSAVRMALQGVGAPSTLTFHHLLRQTLTPGIGVGESKDIYERLVAARVATFELAVELELTPERYSEIVEEFAAIGIGLEVASVL